MKNNVAIANFNVTFGEEDKPLLEYFDSIVYPAFTSDIKRNYKLGGANDKYYFLNVDIIKDTEGDFILTGKLVKETVLEVKSKVEDEQLIKTDEKYPSAPYSVFYIFLKNHRMVLIKNQKGSPDVKSFRITVREIFTSYIKQRNKELAELEAELLPYARVEVVGIPRREDIENIFKNVKKIKRLKLRMYPLNGDMNLNRITESISKDLRQTAGAKTGNIILNSPESKAGVIDIIDASQGVLEPTVEVEYNNGDYGSIKNNEYSEKTTWNLTEEQINNPEVVISKMKGLDSIRIVSEDNRHIYNENKGILNRIYDLIKRK